MSEFEPPVNAQDIPPEVAAKRQTAEEQQAWLDPQAQPSIEAHIRAYADAIETIIVAHRAVADRTDIEIGGETRWSAIWELAGRCLAICRVLVHDLRGGFASEAIGTYRTLHEASQLLAAVTFHEEDEALRRWLAGDWVRPREARAVAGRKQALALGRMKELRVEPVGGDVVELGAEIYDLLSKAAHHRRGGFPESFSQAYASSRTGRILTPQFERATSNTQAT